MLAGLNGLSANFKSDRTDWRVGLNYRWNESLMSAGLMWEGDIGGRGSVVARADYAYQSAVHSAAVNLPYTRVPPYGVYNARLTWRSPDSAWESSFELNNVTVKRNF